MLKDEDTLFQELIKNLHIPLLLMEYLPRLQVMNSEW